MRKQSCQPAAYCNCVATNSPPRDEKSAALVETFTMGDRAGAGLSAGGGSLHQVAGGTAPDAKADRAAGHAGAVKFALHLRIRFNMSNSHATSARFYDPGASPHHPFSPRDDPEGAERRWTLPFVRHPPLLTVCETVSKGGVRPGVVSGQHPRTRPAALHTQTSLRRPRAFYGGFCPRTVSECAGDAQAFTSRSFRPWRPAMAGSP